MECPLPEPPKEKKRGRLKKSKSRNLLERLKTYETETLLFAHRQEVPFSNNQGERDLRMTKVHQKISGCFRSFRGAEIFCRLKSYLGSMQKQGMDAGEALNSCFPINGVSLQRMVSQLRI
ncbi:MAG: transposase [Nitrosarchaeum sp.]